MIKIVAKMTIKPGQVEKVIELTKPLVKASCAEAGCISYALHQDIHNAQILTFIEEWKDQEAIDFHNKTPHFTTIVPQLAAFREGDSEVNLYKQV